MLQLATPATLIPNPHFAKWCESPLQGILCATPQTNTRPLDGPRGHLIRCRPKHVGDDGAPSPPGRSHYMSAGLRTPSRPRFNTCVYTIVVRTSRCPNNSCTVRMSYPASIRCVANEWRNV